LHPRLKSWFALTYAGFTHGQLQALPVILDRESGNVSS
jgi:Lhr-like helicase